MAISEIGLGACTVTFGGTDLGVTSGGVTFSCTYDGVDFMADQYTMPIRREITVENCSCVVPIAEWNYTALAKLLPQGTATTSGAQELLEFGGGGFTFSSDYLALKLDPVDDATDNLQVNIHLALPISVSEIPYNRESYRILGFTFQGYRDSSKAAGKQLFQFGDPAA